MYRLVAEKVVFDYIITTPGYPRHVEGRPSAMPSRPFSMMRKNGSSALKSSRSVIVVVMSREADFPVAPAFGGDLDLVADLRGLLAPDVPLPTFMFSSLSAAASALRPRRPPGPE